jgi:membrane protease YdiL (CAAX protease family)
MSSLDARVRRRFVDTDVRSAVSTLADRTWLLCIAVLPVPLTIAFFVGHSVVTGTARTEYGLPMAYLVYGLANLVTVASLYAVLSPDERTAVFRISTPSPTELGWAVVAFGLGLGVYQLTSRVSGALGFELRGLSYSLSDPTTLVIVVVGAVVIAPVTEEILYRGFVLGVLLSRGLGVVSAVAAMTGIFALIHLPNFGVAGTLFISVWGILPAVLRLRFDDLSGAIVMHGLNNAFAYVLVVGLGLA